MARTPQTSPDDDPFYRRGKTARNSYVDDALPLDAGLSEEDDEEDEPQFRRASRRVPVRRGAMKARTASRVRNVLALVLAAVVLGGGTFAGYRFCTTSPRFVLRSEEEIELASPAANSHEEVMSVLRGDIGRNLFQIPLAQRKQQLEQIPWVEQAAVLRLMPNHLRVMIKERTPVAYVKIGEQVALIDATGVLMNLPAQADYSFPVILGMNENEPQSTRAPRMATYMRLMHELDGGGGKNFSQTISDVDLSDPGDVKVTVRSGSEPVQLYLGKDRFLQRYQVFLNNVQKWEQERGKLERVDLRYDHQVILNPDMQPHAAAPAPESATPAADVDEGQAKPEPRKPEAKKPEAKKSESKKSETKKPEAKKSEAKKAEPAHGATKPVKRHK